MDDLKTPSAFDSRNEPIDVWDSCFPCNDNTAITNSNNHVPRQDMPVVSNATVLQETNQYVAKTLHDLPFQERHHALNDIHGVSDLQEEGKEFIDEHLHLLDMELDKIKIKRAYFIAKSISEKYVSNPTFRLKFLRADNFNAKNAAARMVRHFETKLDIFGKEKLTKDITLRDLTEEDIFHLRTGFFQICSEKDRSGRAILCSQADLASSVPIETRRRITWYNYNTAAEDEETQRKGAVFIFYGLGLQTYSYETNSKVHQLLGVFPVRLTAIHFCYESHVARPVFNLVKAILGKNELGRIRLHFSSRIECVYTLMTFGIPRTIFGSDGHIKTSPVAVWIQKQMADEDARNKSSCLQVPSKFDVLMGKGKRALRSPGTLHLRELMDTYKNEYEEGSRLQKVKITRHIFNEIVSRGGRFLKEGDSGWTQVDDEVAKKKISHDFRNFRRGVLP